MNSPSPVPFLQILAGDGAGGKHDAVEFHPGLIGDVLVEVLQHWAEPLGRDRGDDDVELFGEQVVLLGILDRWITRLAAVDSV